MPVRNTLFDGPTASPRLASLNLELPQHRPNSKHTGRKRSQVPASNLPEDFLAAIEELNARTGNVDSGVAWKPSVLTGRLAQRRFALQLCGWSLAQDDLARAIRRCAHRRLCRYRTCSDTFLGVDGKGRTSILKRRAGSSSPSSTNWLLTCSCEAKVSSVIAALGLSLTFYLDNTDESYHMMSGMLAALTSSSSRNPELLQHCERLIVKLQDPYLRALLTHLTVPDWTEVLQEDTLPLRERLAIAFQFLDDKDVSSYLRRLAERAIHEGDIHGLFVTGLPGPGMDLLQAYVDTSGDVQTAALLASLSPALARDARAARWMNAYRDLLDGWRLFHHRCQLDIERGKILAEAIECGEIQPFDWAPKQILLRCSYCGKAMDPPFPAETNPRVSV